MQVCFFLVCLKLLKEKKLYKKRTRTSNEFKPLEVQSQDFNPLIRLQVSLDYCLLPFILVDSFPTCHQTFHNCVFHLEPLILSIIHVFVLSRLTVFFKMWSQWNTVKMLPDAWSQSHKKEKNLKKVQSSLLRWNSQNHRVRLTACHARQSIVSHTPLRPKSNTAGPLLPGGGHNLNYLHCIFWVQTLPCLTLQR